ncbi:MAG TPA: hypothetical protein ENJ18_03860 [Nannocystis exedens]|nr:hypothetical protein [Nannocystis exedens]
MWIEDRLPHLRATLEYALAEIPYYRESPAYSDAAANLENLADLRRLPILDPDEYASAPERFAVPGLWPDRISFSSTTTGGLGRPRWHLQRELDRFAALVRADTSNPATEDGPVTLVIHPYDQGGAQRPTCDPHTIYSPFLVPWHYQRILELLRKGWRTPLGRRQIDQIDAFSPAHRIYTSWLEQRGIDPSVFGVRSLVGYGSIQSGPWRRRLQRTWNATYEDLYGLSEVKHSSAATCPVCGAYHFTGPIIAEIVDPETRRPKDRGFGVLVLTEVYPYAEIQVLLRYWTDDIVEIAKPCMLADLGFYFRGRRPASLAIGRGETTIYIGALEVGEILSEVADVALSTFPWAAFAVDVGAPRFALQGAPSRDLVRIEVELRYSPALFPSRASSTCIDLRTRLFEQLPALRERVDAGAARLEIIVCEAGSLSVPAKI